ncbi:MAG: zinc/manganese transport system permease protein [Planctomycetota bacterium]|jgi:zinc/manganese transport system permease protein
MAWPFAACLVLTGIHVYLGIHVIERRVVFVDLALAQIAALGTVWGVLLGWSLESDDWIVKGISLGFSVIGAGIFAVTRTRRERIPHEAIIGIIYSVALATTVLASANLAHGAEEVREILSGSILWVREETVYWTAGLYVFVGLVHWIFRKQFFRLSQLSTSSPDGEEGELDSSARLWDFLFYTTFGLVVTSSVSIGGVLLVFSYLVIPAVAAMMFMNTIRSRLLFGWGVGAVMSAVGVFISYENDLPSGPTIVVCLGLFLALSGIFKSVRQSSNPIRTLLRTSALVLIVCTFVGGTWYSRPQANDTLDLQLTSSDSGERLRAIERVLGDRSLEFEASPYLPDLLADSNAEVRRIAYLLVVRRPEPSFVRIVIEQLNDDDDLWREEAIGVLRDIGSPASIEALALAASSEVDEFLRAEMAEALLFLSDSRGGLLLIELMDRSGSALLRGDAWMQLDAHMKLDQEFDSSVSAKSNDDSVQAIREAVLARD